MGQASDFGDKVLNELIGRITDARDSADAKEKYVRHIFDSIARRYDLMNVVMSMGLVKRWHKAFAQVTNLAPGDSALDVCCGTAELSIIMARQVGRQGQVFGIDFSNEMLSIGRRKVQRVCPELPIKLIQGNALSLPFDESSFHCVASGFALRNLVDLPRAIAEMARVTKPGGRVISLELTKPKNRVVRQLYYFYFFKMVPLMGRVVERGAGRSLKAYTYLPHSLVPFLDADELDKVFQQAGLVNVTHRYLSCGIVAIHVGMKI